MPEYRVLIVDDQHDVRHMLRAGIGTLGLDIQVIDVPSGEEAILVISRYPIDLLISDVRLPGISGLELKERAQVRNPGLKFILMTGLSEPKVRREVSAAGADAYFFKPVELTDFLDSVQKCLGLEQVAVKETFPEEGYPAVVLETSPQSLSERLSGLRQQVGGVCAVLLDDLGQIMAQAGNFPASLDETALIPSLMATFSAAIKVSYLLEIKSPSDWLFFDGQEFDLFLTHVGPTLGLLLVVPNAAWDDPQMWKLLRAMRTTAQDLLTILTRAGVSLEPEAERQPVSEAVSTEEEIEDVSELEAIFSKPAKKKLKPEDVDAFWDSLATDQLGEITRADAISYEQARQLGLAPDE